MFVSHNPKGKKKKKQSCIMLQPSLPTPRSFLCPIIPALRQTGDCSIWDQRPFKTRGRCAFHSYQSHHNGVYLLSYSSFIKLLLWMSWFWFLPVYLTGDEDIAQMLKALPQLQGGTSSPQLRGAKAFLELKDTGAILQKSLLHEKLLKEVESWTNFILIYQHLF